jgi:hypothetical protein
MKNSHILRLATLLGAIGPFGSHAFAATVPSATFSQILNGDLANAITSAGTYSSLAVTSSAYYANGSGLVAVSADNTTQGNQQESAAAKLYYAFEVTGPTNSTALLDFSSVAALALNSGYEGASAQVSIGSCPGCSDLYSISDSIGAGMSGNNFTSGGFSANTSFVVSTNTINYVGLLASGITYGGGGTFSASVDPSITFDPSFNSTGYSLSYSADVMPAPVPLPASAWMMLSGLFGLGALARKPLSTFVS